MAIFSVILQAIFKYRKIQSLGSFRGLHPPGPPPRACPGPAGDLWHDIIHRKRGLSHRKGGNKEAIFYFGDRFCYVDESRALELYSHSLTQLLFLTRCFFCFVKAIHFSFFLGGWVGHPVLQD